MLKGCGLYLVDLPLFDAIRQTPRTAMRDEYEITDSIQILIDYEYPVRVSPLIEWDINVTYIEDLIACSTHVLRKMNKPFLSGQNCKLAQGVELVETVLGDGVSIAKPMRLERCVVLSGVELTSGGEYHDTVFTKSAAGRTEAASEEGILRTGQEDLA